MGGGARWAGGSMGGGVLMSALVPTPKAHGALPYAAIHNHWRAREGGSGGQSRRCWREMREMCRERVVDSYVMLYAMHINSVKMCQNDLWPPKILILGPLVLGTGIRV